MAAEVKKEIQLEIGHVLFIDIAGYSKLSTNDQHAAVEELNQIVRASEQSQRAEAAGRLIKIPTGDGMALVFYTSPEAPAQCAVEISRALKEYPRLQLRMGVHSGPVSGVIDVRGQANLAGAGLNMAQRVMDCGDAGHILLSKHVAEDLEEYEQWRPLLHELGSCEVKHGVRVHLYNLYGDGIGNTRQPQKLRAARAKIRHRRELVGLAALAIVAAIAAGFFLHSQRAHALTSKDTIVLADFVNKTGDAVFDDTLKQAVAVALGQSPFLNLLSDEKVNETLKLMGRNVGERLTPEIARDLCIRSNCKAMLTGNISSLGSQYVIGLKAIQCSDGDTIAAEQVQANGKEQVLQALDKVAREIREKLGESIATIKQFDTPLADATTPSLEALKAYSIGRKTSWERSANEAIPFYKRAIELDPNFASAYLGLATAYLNIDQVDMGRENLKKAYGLRDRTSERERLSILALYYGNITGEKEKAIQTYKLWAQSYPRDMIPHADLAVPYFGLGQYDNALAEIQEAFRLAPPDGINYWNLMAGYICLNRWEEAKSAYNQAVSLKLDNAYLHIYRYYVAFHEHDAAEMERQQTWAHGKPEEVLLLFAAANAEEYTGHARNAGDLIQRIVETSTRSGDAEFAALAEMLHAAANVDFGNVKQARQGAAAALIRASTKDVRIGGATVLARAGEIERATSLADEVAKEYPLDTILNSYDVPVIRGAIEITRGNPLNAIEALKKVTPYELSSIEGLYASYLRGLAFLDLHMGNDAATEFQRILDHPGIVRTNCQGALAHLQLGRAKVITGDKQGARKAYTDFLGVWKDADPEIPILQQAKAEYAKLQ